MDISSPPQQGATITLLVPWEYTVHEGVERKKNRLSHRKESSANLDPTDDVTTSDSRVLTGHVYPFALVLRLRVLQIVCGISSLVMGTVAFIEERGKINLGLGMPAGIFTVIAAALSIHTSRGFSGYKQPSCGPPMSSYRFLGPSLSVAVPLTLLWGVACLLQACLLAIACWSLSSPAQIATLAAVLLTLSVVTLAAVLATLRIDCRYDPD